MRGVTVASIRLSLSRRKRETTPSRAHLYRYTTSYARPRVTLGTQSTSELREAPLTRGIPERAAYHPGHTGWSYR
jgi:hypothetical protein